MTYEDLIILVPCHSLEDFPTELPDAQAASLLNSWVVPWHPRLIASAGIVPRWQRADDPPELTANRLIMLPTKCKELVPAGWVERVRNEGGVVVADLTERDPMLAQALEPLGPGGDDIDPDLVADFLALGFCYLQIELLTRHMRHFSNLDEVHLQREAVAAAAAAVANDATTARTRLRACFEVLTEARERFYPVDCYLIDLCLLIPRLADDKLLAMLHDLKPTNTLLTAQDLQEIAAQKPEIIAALREAWDRGSTDVIGGEWREAPTPMLPLESVLWQFSEGHRVFQETLKRVPRVWGQRRYGIFPQLPQILQKNGYHGAMHVALDDGLYPDVEHSKIRWEGTNGTVMDAISRIPLAADSANSYLRFPQRMAESMDNDHVATVIFARWPEVKAPWYEDLRRMHNYSPVLGRFVTLDDYFQNTDSSGRISSYDVNDYLAPFLVQSVARDEANPISRYIDQFRRRARFDTAAWYRGVRAALMNRSVSESLDRKVEQVLEAASPDAEPEAIQAAEDMLATFVPQSVRELAELVGHGGQNPGCLILNPLSFQRRVSISLPDWEVPPALDQQVKFVQWDQTHRLVTLDLPGSGFVWIPQATGTATATAAKEASAPMAEDNVLRNEFFEVFINEQTGGIGQVKGYGRSPNRISQQLALRFPRERTISSGEEDILPVKSYYSQMVVRSSEVTSVGPAMGEIVTKGDLIDQTNDRRLAGYQQTVRVWRGRRVVEVEVELDLTHLPDGDPWTNYYAARFAWNDSLAALTRSVMQGAQGVKDQRYESPHYLEIATEEHRTTILNFGLPFHRKTGDRMVDSLLVTAGETQRKFQFVIALDNSYPMQAALDAHQPVDIIPTLGPPRSGTTGWFFHLDVRNVQITRVLGLQEEPPEHVDLWDRHDQPQIPAGKGYALRLLETEGKPVRCRLRTFRQPVRARQRNFDGRTLSDLTLEEDAVIIDLTPYEIADVELRFE